MAPSPVAGEEEDSQEEEAARVRAQNELLRAENLRLRAAVFAARPDTPPDESFVPSTPSGGALGAADRLVHLMQEGGNLLKEREALRRENEALESELEAAVDGREVDEVPPDQVLEGAGGPDEADLPEEETTQEGDGAAVSQLMPLLSEGDALRTERQGLRAERKELLSELTALGGDAGDAQEEAIDEVEAGDRELEERFLVAVEEASKENASLEAEIKLLREDNSRLRSKAEKAETEATKDINTDDYHPTKPTKVVEAHSVTKPERTFKPKPKGPLPDDVDVAFQQREAMVALLRKSQGGISPNGQKTSPTTRDPSQLRMKADLDKSQEQQMKGALHTLFSNFGK